MQLHNYIKTIIGSLTTRTEGKMKPTKGHLTLLFIWLQSPEIRTETIITSACEPVDLSRFLPSYQDNTRDPVRLAACARG